MIRLILFLAIVGGLTYCGATVPLGNKTFFGHIRAIWHTEEVQELKDGVKKEAGPAVERLERGVKAGYKAATGSDGSAGSGSAAQHTTP